MNETGKSVTITGDRKHVVCPVYLDLRNRNNGECEWSVLFCDYSKPQRTIEVSVEYGQKDAVMVNDEVNEHLSIEHILIKRETDDGKELIFNRSISSVLVDPGNCLTVELQEFWDSLANFPRLNK